jgi:hypothetical protein
VAKYKLRYFFDAGAGICLWAPNDAAREKFGYPVEFKVLGLPENTVRRGYYITAWYDTSIDWSYPPDPSPWDALEGVRFKASAQEFLELLRRELGPEFEIIDESGTGESA